MIKLLLSITALSFGLYLYNHVNYQKNILNLSEFQEFKEF